MATTWYIDELNGLDAQSGLTPALPVKTWAQLVTNGRASGDTVYYKNMRSAVNWTVSNFTMLLGDQTVPCSRGDTILSGTWTLDQDNVTRKTWKSPAFALPMVNVGTVVVNYDSTTPITGGGIPAHLKPQSSLANVRANPDSWFCDGTNMYVTLGPTESPNTDVVAYTQHYTSGAETNAISLIGDNNFVESFHALWTEAGGAGSGANGLGGWGVILRGNDCRILVYGARDYGYKAFAIVGNRGIIEGTGQATIAGFSHSSQQGLTANGNAAITIQGPVGSNVTSALIRKIKFYEHALLWRNNSQPLAAVTQAHQTILCHGQTDLLTGLVVTLNEFYNPFDQTLGYVYADNLTAVPTIAKTGGPGHPFIVRRNKFFSIRQLTSIQHAHFDQNLIFATVGPLTTSGAVFERIGANPSPILTLTGNVVIYYGVPGGLSLGLLVYIQTGMEVYLVGNTCYNIYSATNAFSAIAQFQSTGVFYSRQNVFYMAQIASLNNKGIFNSTVGTVDIQYTYCIGMGCYNISGAAWSLPTTFNSDNSGTGTSIAVTDTANTNVFRAPLTTTDQTGSDYRFAIAAASGLARTRNFITPHMEKGPDGLPWTGYFGAYQASVVFGWEGQVHGQENPRIIWSRLR